VPSAKKKPAAKIEAKPVRFSRAAATQKFLDATISLIAKKPIPDISLQEIAEITGLNHGYVFRYFGTRIDLFTAVTDELARLAQLATQKEIEGRIKRNEAPMPLDLTVLDAGRKYTYQRQQVIQYLVTCGVKPKRFAEKSRELTGELAAQFQKTGMNPRFAQALAVKLGILLWSEMFLMESFGITPEEALDIHAMAFDEISQHKATTKRLGWN
jgi:AcrR family transcriptional regulator